MFAAERLVERRTCPRRPLDVLLTFVGVGTSVEVKARCLDLSARGVQVRLPIPMPDLLVGGTVEVRSSGTRTFWGAATIGRLTSDRYEVVLVFPDTPRELATLLEQAGSEQAEVAPQGHDAVVDPALERARDVVSFVARLARSAAALVTRAWVCWVSETGWTPVVECDGRRLRWGAELHEYSLDGRFSVLRVGDEPGTPLLLLLKGRPRPEGMRRLERLAAQAAAAWQGLAPSGRRFLAWCALRPEARRLVLEGLEDRSLAVRRLSLETLERHGVDTLNYTLELPRAACARLRREIEELASFREWFIAQPVLNGGRG
jgi:hypothetical protein